MEETNNKRFVWTFDECKKEALKYNHRSEFKNNSKSSYKAAHRNKWLDEICSHMIDLKRSLDSWTIEECREEAQKYKTRSEFYKNSKKFYTVCTKNNWLDDVCSHMFEIKKKAKNTTFEDCEREAVKYKTRHEFQLKAQLFYKVARKNDWLDKVCSHMEELMKPRNYWTYEICKEEALKYETRNEFHKNSRGAYDVCHQNDWMDDLCSHMKDGYKIAADNIRIWTYETCMEEALKYEFRNDFHKNSRGAYDACQKNGWMNEFCSHMKDGVKIAIENNRIWTYDICKEEALKYETKTEFYTNCRSAYSACHINGWIDELCSHMRICGNNYLRFVYAFEFEDNHVYIGLTHDIKEREEDHLKNENSQIFKHIQKTNSKYFIKKIVQEPIPKEEAQTLEHSIKISYQDSGWNILNKAKTGTGIGSLGGNNLKWTYEKCKEEALKYDTKLEFRKKSNSAYDACVRNKWIDDLCSHMTSKRKPSGYWTFERCEEEVSKHKSRMDFQNNASGAYSASLQNGWLDKLFPNDKKLKPPGYWTYETCKEEALKYDSFSKLKKESSSAYNVIRKNNWFQELCSHITLQQKPNGYWTYERCHEEALKYETRTEFKNNSNTAYYVCSKNNWLDEVCSHMIELKKPNGYWTIEKCHEEALKYDNKKDFKTKSSQAYYASKNNKWFHEISSHMINRRNNQKSS